MGRRSLSNLTNHETEGLPPLLPDLPFLQNSMKVDFCCLLQTYLFAAGPARQISVCTHASPVATLLTTLSPAESMPSTEPAVKGNLPECCPGQEGELRSGISPSSYAHSRSFAPQPCIDATIVRVRVDGGGGKTVP